MGIDQIAPEAIKLSVRECALLASALWESIEDPFELSVEQTDDEAIALAVVRDAEKESGAVQPHSHPQIMQSLRR